MKVLFMANIPSPYRVDFFNELGKKCELTVTFEGQTATDRDEKWKSDLAHNFTGIYLKGKRVSNDSFFCPGILKVLNKKWDKIIVGVYSTLTSMLAIEYMKIRKIPFFIEADGGLIHNDSKFKFKLKKHFISSAEAWLSSGRETTRYLVHYGAKEEKCYTYPFTSLRKKDLNNAESICSKGKEFYKERIGVKEKKMLLSVGRFSYDRGYGKGYDILMNAAQRIKDDVGIYIVGGEPTEEFKQWKVEKNLSNVHFVEFKRKDDLIDYYAAADLFVLMTRSDVWGLVINEAMSFGLPIITTDQCIAGLELVIDGANGYVISVDEKQLVNKVTMILYDENLMERLGKKSFEMIYNYTIENMALAHMNVFEVWDEEK